MVVAVTLLGEVAFELDPAGTATAGKVVVEGCGGGIASAFCAAAGAGTVVVDIHAGSFAAGVDGSVDLRTGGSPLLTAPASGGPGHSIKSAIGLPRLKI